MMFDNLSPEQLRIALAAAYDAVAEYEAEVRGLRAEMAVSWAEKEELKIEGRTDSLTGALNRKGVEAALTEEMSFSARFKSPLSVIAVDVDTFKGINDTHGHPVGDAVLREIVRRFRLVLRPYDTLGRPGGDEMTIILRGASKENAARVAERLRSAVAGEPFSCGDSIFSVTISLGVAEMSDKGSVKTADEALYAAKRGGRNRVEM
jgi:diguanylate cyclase (GGDEF)-like protein